MGSGDATASSGGAGSGDRIAIAYTLGPGCSMGSGDHMASGGPMGSRRGAGDLEAVSWALASLQAPWPQRAHGLQRLCPATAWAPPAAL